MNETVLQSWGIYYERRSPSLGDILRSLAGHAPLFEAISDVNPRRILEVGSGTGIMAIFLSWLGYEVVSVDNDPAVLAAAETLSRRMNGNSIFRKADAFHLSNNLGNTSFDIAFSQGFFEHFGDEQIVQLIHAQLRVAQVVIFSVPSRYYGVREFGNERLLSAAAWRDILKGFHIAFVREYYPKQRGLKSIARDVFTRPWRLFPWRQPEHLLIRIDRSAQSA